MKRNQKVVNEARFLLWNVVTCAYCMRKGSPALDPDNHPWHMDHIKPLFLGGDDHIDNITKACAACNLDKGAENWQRLTNGVLTAGKAKALKFQGYRKITQTNDFIKTRKESKNRASVREEKWKREWEQKKAREARAKAQADKGWQKVEITELKEALEPVRTTSKKRIKK